MYVCICFVYIYATHMYVCIYAYMQTRMNVCVYVCGHVHVFACLCMCAFYVCVCSLKFISLCACLYSPTNLSSVCIYIHCHQLVLLSLSQDILSLIFISHLFFLSYCIIERTVMNIEDRGSLTLYILLGISLIFTLLCVG